MTEKQVAGAVRATLVLSGIFRWHACSTAGPMLPMRQERWAGWCLRAGLAGQPKPEYQQHKSAAQQGAERAKGFQWTESVGLHAGSWREKSDPLRSVIEQADSHETCQPDDDSSRRLR